MMWHLFKTKLKYARSILAEAYFKLPTDEAEEALFKALDAIDEALKVADEYTSNKDYSSKYRGYGIVGDEIDDHTSVWGGAGPDCMPKPE